MTDQPAFSLPAPNDTPPPASPYRPEYAAWCDANGADPASAGSVARYNVATRSEDYAETLARAISRYGADSPEVRALVADDADQDDDRPCPCGRSHTAAEHGYDPDEDDADPMKLAPGEGQPGPDECAYCGAHVDERSFCPAQGADKQPHRRNFRIGTGAPCRTDECDGTGFYGVTASPGYCDACHVIRCTAADMVEELDRLAREDHPSYWSKRDAAIAYAERNPAAREVLAPVVPA